MSPLKFWSSACLVTIRHQQTIHMNGNLAQNHIRHQNVHQCWNSWANRLEPAGSNWLQLDSNRYFPNSSTGEHSDGCEKCYTNTRHRNVLAKLCYTGGNAKYTVCSSADVVTLNLYSCSCSLLQCDAGANEWLQLTTRTCAFHQFVTAMNHDRYKLENHSPHNHHWRMV